jgi:hypothetical protein
MYLAYMRLDSVYLSLDELMLSDHLVCYNCDMVVMALVEGLGFGEILSRIQLDRQDEGIYKN